MKQQEMYWEDEAQEFYTIAPKKMNMLPVYTVVYFLLLAIVVVPAQAHHMGTQGIFLAMVGAGLVLGLILLVVRYIKREIAKLNLTQKGFIQMMVGSRPDTTPAGRGTQAQDRALVPAASTSVVRYGEALDSTDAPPAQIVEEYPMFIAESFQPSVKGLLGSMSLVCGIRRSGKSNLLAVLCEELAYYEVPLVVFDTEDEYGGLANKKYMPNAVHVGSPLYRKESPNPGNYIELDTEGAYAFGAAILEGRLQVVVNLKSWQDEDAALIMCEIIDGLNDWEEGKDNADRLPVMIAMDEATKWLPQNLKDGWVTSERQTALHHAFFDIVVARGGKRGFGFIAACQRYSQLNKNVLQSQWKFLFNQTEEIDVNRYAKQGLDEDEVRALQQGQCFIFSPLVIGFKAMIRKRTSPHMGNTPGLENLRRGRQMQGTLVESDNATRVLAESMPVLPANPRPRTKSDLEKVIELHRENSELSYREMAEKLGFGKDKVAMLVKEAKERGMIE